jgi:glycosyltransferase involved in cell wall biosynthesis
MRAGVFLELLAERFDVTLCVVQLYGRRPFAEDERLLSRCSQFVRFTPDSLRKRGGTAPELAGREFTHVHVFRLVMASWLQLVLPQQKQRPRFTLDLDDYESQTQGRFVELYAANNLPERAEKARAQAAKSKTAEGNIIPFFDATYVCSETDRAPLAKQFPDVRVIAVPNVVRMPEPAPSADKVSTFQFLFVGTMSYYPNEDAIVWFCTEVLPLLRSIGEAAFRVTIVGRTSDAIGPLAEILEVDVLGEVDSLTECYLEADVAIVPIRAGGGTRIKILEAMSYGIPVISTTVGAEGLELDSVTDLVIADSAEEFAEGCLNLMANPAKRSEIAAAGSHWVRQHHSLDNARAALAEEMAQ